jgi:hypothetical protein
LVAAHISTTDRAAAPSQRNVPGYAANSDLAKPRAPTDVQLHWWQIKVSVDARMSPERRRKFSKSDAILDPIKYYN